MRKFITVVVSMVLSITGIDLTTSSTCENIEGTWSVNEQCDADSCGGGTENDTYLVTVTQDGCNLTAVAN